MLNVDYNPCVLHYYHNNYQHEFIHDHSHSDLVAGHSTSAWITRATPFSITPRLSMVTVMEAPSTVGICQAWAKLARSCRGPHSSWPWRTVSPRH